MATAGFVQPIQIVLSYFVPLDVDVVPIKFHKLLLGDHFCVFQFICILAVCMAAAANLKKSTLKSRTSHGI
jgi:hypothetical protein